MCICRDIHTQQMSGATIFTRFRETETHAVWCIIKINYIFNLYQISILMPAKKTVAFH